MHDFGRVGAAIILAAPLCYVLFASWLAIHIVGLEAKSLCRMSRYETFNWSRSHMKIILPTSLLYFVEKSEFK
jgi:hypothetical protein